jgi:hypothetical protein
MLFFGRFAPWCAVSFTLLLGAIDACSDDSDNGFSSNGGAGNEGATGSTTKGGGAAQTGTTSSTQITTPTAGTTGTTSSSDAGVVVPPSTISEDPDTYTTSCEAEGCGSDEKCFEKCPNGSCCVHPCEGQTGTMGSTETTCCDKQGGIVPGASCN